MGNVEPMKKYYDYIKSVWEIYNDIDTGFFRIIENNDVCLDTRSMLDFYMDFFSNFDCNLYTKRVMEGEKIHRIIQELNEEDFLFYQNFLKNEIEKYDELTIQKLLVNFDFFDTVHGLDRKEVRLIKKRIQEKKEIQAILKECEIGETNIKKRL